MTFTLCTCLGLCSSACADIKTFPATGALSFKLADEIELPMYAWPRTLLSYPVDFSHVRVLPGNLRLVDAATGKPVPMQLSGVQLGPGGALQSACVNFFSDLPSGGEREFDLMRGTPAPATASVHVIRSAGTIQLDGAGLAVRIPDSIPAVPANAAVPGPILALNQGRGWMGQSRIWSPNKRVLRVETQFLEQGPLFATVQVTYAFAGGASYVATIQSVLGYPFVQFSERMSGLDPSDGAQLVMHWTGFAPSKRFAAGGWMGPQAGRGIDDPVVTPGMVEEPHWMPPDTIEDPTQEMICHLASFQGNGVRDASPAMSFWDDRPGGQELGVFVPDTRDWDDGQYTIWQPSPRLQVRFRHRDSVLDWLWPLVDGSRTTGIELNDPARGTAAVEALRATYIPYIANGKSFGEGSAGSVEDSVKTYPVRYAGWLRGWYGGLNLNRVKDWVLTYPATAKLAQDPFASAPEATPESVDRLISHSTLLLYPLGLNLAVLDLNHRVVRPIVENYLAVQSRFAPEEKRRLDALLLLSAYVNSGEDIAPVRTCATGCPNMSADGFSVPSEIGLLFPDHPMGSEWREQFQKTVELMGCYYTRPAVPALDSLGGRWAESLAVYNSAYLTPTEAGNTGDELTDGVNRCANPWTALKGDWLVDSATAPIFNPSPYWRQDFSDARQAPPPLSPDWKPGMPLDKSFGFERQYPAYGSHGTGTTAPVSGQLTVLADALMRYAPMTAEHMLWLAGQNTDADSIAKDENPWEKIKTGPLAGNDGTEPELKSCKYTGNGIILRAGVNTPEELSIHLEQVDRGPNYRWGWNGESSSGLLYFYAGGQVWTGHERENTGDHTNDDVTGTTTFGVLKDGRFKSIGENLLTQPLYDLGAAQFAEIVPRPGPGAYSWPVYKSRSVMLVGTDYFILADDVGDDGRAEDRFSWFQARDLPFPKLVFLQPLTTRTDHFTEIGTATSKGFLRDAEGPSIVLVTHKNAVDMEDMTSRALPFLENTPLRQYGWARGVKPVPGVYRVTTPTSHDVVFRAMDPVEYQSAGENFAGDAGVIRHRTDGNTELALFQGTSIGANGVNLAVPAGDGVGVSARFAGPGHIAGYFFAPEPSKIALTLTQPAALSLYIDGAKVASGTGVSITFAAPTGRHTWEATSGLPKPVAPAILRTVNRSGGADLVFTTCPGADHYAIQISRDGGATWQDFGNAAAGTGTLTGLADGTKVQARVLAANAAQTSDPSAAYPIYVTDRAPLPPDGLSLILGNDRVDASWGEILGASAYRLYRRTLPAGEWKLVYAGLNRTFSDVSAQGTVPPSRYPGTEDNPGPSGATRLYAYAVAAVSGNGEGPKSNAVDTNPASWLNWWPAGQAREFKRQTAYWMPPYVPADETPPLRYPGP